MSRAHELADAAVWTWPVDITQDLDEQERAALAILIRHGRPWLFDRYRARLRARGLSWLGIPTAELTPERMARVLLLLDRPPAPAAGVVITVPCLLRFCGDGHGGHTLTLTAE